MDLARMSAVDLIAAYKARALSPVEATAAAFSRIRQANSRVNAFCYLLEEEAMAAAKA